MRSFAQLDDQSIHIAMNASQDGDVGDYTISLRLKDEVGVLSDYLKVSVSIVNSATEEYSEEIDQSVGQKFE